MQFPFAVSPCKQPEPPVKVTPSASCQTTTFKHRLQVSQFYHAVAVNKSMLSINPVLPRDPLFLVQMLIIRVLTTSRVKFRFQCFQPQGVPNILRASEEMMMRNDSVFLNSNPNNLRQIAAAASCLAPRPLGLPCSPRCLLPFPTTNVLPLKFIACDTGSRKFRRSRWFRQEQVKTGKVELKGSYFKASLLLGCHINKVQIQAFEL